MQKDSSASTLLEIFFWNSRQGGREVRPPAWPPRQAHQSRPTHHRGMVVKHYADIFRVPGAKGFSSAGFLGRLPLSMVGLGTILMIKESTGKYALAGIV